MHKRIAFKNTEHSAPMEQHIDKELERIMLFLRYEAEPIYIDIIVEPSKVHAHHRVEFSLKAPDYDLSVEREGPHPYQVVDDVIHTMYRLLQKRKDRLVDKRAARHTIPHDREKK